MARPKTKEALLQAGNDTYLNMMELLDTLPQESLTQNFTFDVEKEKQAHWQRDKNLRDVFVHLYEWHKLLLDWVAANQKGKAKQFLKAGYNWKTYGKMNEEFFLKHQNTSYEEALQLIAKTHYQVMDLAKTFSNEELFEKGVFPWVGGSTLGSYFVSATASHYEWAMKKIKRFKKSL
ncbi:ClbS/DfsB family four-helix bundle protein [Enterococcus montenegrensis]|uniref:ClbS/DfsB family four-helix bundle protein n=1 Tax=Enterococcus TaxID=1350 RepID=UPI001E3A754C|nr:MULTISPECIES: ClbS/DfsB family four-helix bundle protein [Enterococcus]MCD1025640.1 ClbS/DfsB family four-helix bundle protein [Enterococcus sp. SMC-9]WHA09705.1 ClbS/DfsB family four-helix bundle protein [Enterococcus montenegrensis]